MIACYHGPPRALAHRGADRGDGAVIRSPLSRVWSTLFAYLVIRIVGSCFISPSGRRLRQSTDEKFIRDGSAHR
jgi:hypothetical protein